ncbi:MAG TPA: hypothetical protein VIN56_09515 [Candidatus Dormibacteraeota bacterium]|jgi:hypothetical protein
MSADLQHVEPGVGYWAHFSDLVTFTLLPSRQSSASVTVSPGRCAMVGNPSSGASARVLGARPGGGLFALAERLYG